MIPPSLRRACRAACALALAATFANGMPQSTSPRPSGYALTNVRLDVAEEAPRKTLILREGRIVEIRDGAEQVPAGLRLVDGEGLIGGKPSELSDPFFYRDDLDWLGLWNNDELVVDESAD